MDIEIIIVEVLWDTKQKQLTHMWQVNFRFDFDFHPIFVSIYKRLITKLKLIYADSIVHTWRRSIFLIRIFVKRFPLWATSPKWRFISVRPARRASRPVTISTCVVVELAVIASITSRIPSIVTLPTTSLGASIAVSCA